VQNTLRNRILTEPYDLKESVFFDQGKIGRKIGTREGVKELLSRFSGKREAIKGVQPVRNNSVTEEKGPLLSDDATQVAETGQTDRQYMRHSNRGILLSDQGPTVSRKQKIRGVT